MLLTLCVGFVVGALAILVAEVLGILFIIRRLNRRSEQAAANSVISGELDPSFYNKQGVVWVLESEKVPKAWLSDKGPREQKRKKEILAVTPVRKYAKIKSQSLLLTESDNSYTEIWLKGCIIVAVSATSLPSRKWVKRYPIKVESKTSVIYHGSKTVYLYLETSWEKESWCKALRIASCYDKEKLKWFANLNLEFHSYLASLTTGYPSFMKPSMGFSAESVDKSLKVDGSSSKVRQFLKKIAKKASKSGLENKLGRYSTSYREEKKINENSRLSRESVLATGLVNTTPSGEALNCFVEENMIPSSSSWLTHTGSTGHISVVSEADSDDKIAGDEGTLCWNLLISRLFFDVKSNAEMKSSMQAWIQRTLSNMRIPSYIGEVTCTGIDPGNLPPYIHGMRVLPSDMNELWALEIDIEYSGGAVVDIETRLEVRDLDFQEGIADTDLESSSVEEATSDLLEGFEFFRDQLKLSEGTVNEIECKEEADPKLDGIKSCKSISRAASHRSRWKSIINSIAKQVSQVPLSMGIRLASIRGTMRLRIKPPPSDQLWFGFTSMPDIDFNFESFVGERKITSGHIALFLISRFKTAIRETLVLPNCESVSIPWMKAEKDDWVPRKFAPFEWIKQESVSADPATVHDVASSQLSEATHLIEASQSTTSNSPEDEHDNARKVESIRQPITLPPDKRASSSSLAIQATLNDKPVQELRTPLLSNGDLRETRQGSEVENPECLTPSRSLLLLEEPNHVTEGDDTSLKRMSKRERMLSLRKKMGGKFEEKRRNIVERMRGPQN